MDKYKEIQILVAQLEKDVIKYYTKGNQTAGVRVRVALQTLKDLAQELRVDISSKYKKKSC